MKYMTYCSYKLRQLVSRDVMSGMQLHSGLFAATLRVKITIICGGFLPGISIRSYKIADSEF